MNHIAPLHFKFIYVDAKDSDERLRIFYYRIFAVAKKNVIVRKSRKPLTDKSTKEYIRVNER